MPLKRLEFEPGVDKRASQYAAPFRWYDADKVRFKEGRPQQIGGWVKFTQTAYRGVCRSLHDWSARTGSNYLGIGTNLKFYIESGTTLNDVTPIRVTTAAGDVTFAATNGSSIITVSDTTHGANNNDFVTFSGAAALGGNITAPILNAEYQVVSVVDVNSYTIDVGVAANASDTGNGGATTVGEYQIGVGTNFFVIGTGWGVGGWGEQPWNASLGLSSTNQLRLYSQDTFEDDLIFNPRGGSVYYWDETNGVGTRAIDLSQLPTASDTPTKALQVMVSDVDRHVIAFGCNALGGSDLDPLLVRWSDQEDAGNWTPSSTNSAGGQVLSGGTLILAAVKTRREIIIYTDEGLTSMRFTGAPFVFSFSLVADGVSIIGPNAAAVVADTVYFMDREGFYMYKGSVERIPCPIYDHVYENVNLEQRNKIFAGVVQDDHEVIWFYPVGSGATEITHYVSYNYVEGVWSIGTLERAAWTQASTRNYPIAASANVANVDNNYIYNHEFGYTADGSEINSYIESGGLEIGDGEQLQFIRRLLADFRYSGNEDTIDITVTIKGRKYPLDEFLALDTANITNTTSQNHVRVRAREIALRIESNGNGYGWTMGDFRIDIRTDGRR